MTGKRKAAIAIGMIAVVGLFFLLPKHKCGDEENDPVYSMLIARAKVGDRLAIAKLYAYDKKRNIQPFVEYWAFEGALQGDDALRREYVALFRKQTSEEQQRDLEIIKRELAKPGAPCLFAVLTNDKQQQTVCAAIKQENS